MAIDKAKYIEIISSLQRKDFLEAIIGLNSFIPGYSNFGVLYFYRGMARMGINDVPEARKDFLKAMGSGYGSGDIYLKAMTSKEYMVKKIMTDLKEEPLLDSLRPAHYRT
jgi:hypothetical protein